MEPTHSLWIFFVLTFGIIVLPGLDMAFIVGTAVAAGARAGGVALAGIVVGGVIHVLINLSGLAALLLWWPAAFNLLLLAGAAYMAWIGWGMVRAAWQPAVAAAAEDVSQPARLPRSSLAIFSKGVLNCLLNPKAYAFMLAVFPAYLQTQERSVLAQAALLSAIIAGNQIVIYGTVLLSALGARRVAAPGAGAQRGLLAGVGLLLIAAAALTLLSAWK
ncbi:LysE family translocator [Roseateles sp.]|uniref:LysE family translocator n=1 Tax=Roseateles sp. TaxID=1971397 RepID=UPI003D0DB671